MLRIICDATKTERIDRFLSSRQVSGFYSRSRIEKLFEGQGVLVNGKPVKKSHLVQAGDVIEYVLPETEPERVIGEDIPLKIIYEDEYLAVINKPAGLTVHPGAGTHSGTLVNALVHHFGTQLSSGSDTQRPGIVHRLDKDTSGLLLVAKQDRVHYLLGEQFQKREITKKYLAITTGVPEEPEGEIRNNLARNRQNRKKMCVCEVGRLAISIYRVMENLDYFALVEIELKTGRTHQIRVHLESINCPVLGDSMYNNQKRVLYSVPVEYRKRLKYLMRSLLRRQALHAWKLGFVHPVSEEKLEFTAEMPADMQKAVDYIRELFI